jgi:hypothetical protein
MNSVVGFTIFSNLPEKKLKVLQAAHDRALAYFALQRRSLVLGETRLELWGRKGMEERIHTLPDGSLAILVGSPHGKAVLRDVQDDLLSGGFELPWDGRVILLHVSADGRRWMMWNDWLGSIPVFHTSIGRERVASTLEPVTVAAAGYTSDDFFLPGLVSLLINGHFISDWTLYKGMRVIPPDSFIEWDENGFRAKTLWTVKPSQSRWETAWDDLVDEMFELSHTAIADILKTQSTWILPLSSGLDSRLIAGVAADIGANIYSYVYGASDTTDVVYSRKIAEILEIPWKHVNLPNNFILKYTPCWADLFGSSMHFHGMYQMAFLDSLINEPAGSVISGFIGDTLSGDAIIDLVKDHSGKSYSLNGEWYSDWSVELLKRTARFPLEDDLEANADELKRQIDLLPGAFFQKIQFPELWYRQRLFISFQGTLSDYWRGVATPYMDRAYARFCMSLPRAALDSRHLLAGVYRRYYGRLAVIPGTYYREPFILTGRYLLSRRIAKHLPAPIRRKFFAGFDNVPLRMDMESIQAIGRDALWPLFDVKDQLAGWVDVDQLEQDYQTIMHSRKDIRPLRRLQSVQALAYRLVDWEKMSQ